MDLLNFDIISVQKDSKRDIQNTRTTIDRPLQSFHAPLKLINTQSLIIVVLNLTSTLASKKQVKKFFWGEII